MTESLSIAVIGPFPPPVHGASLATEYIAAHLVSEGKHVTRIDLASPSLDRALWARLGRVPRLMRGMAALARLMSSKRPVVYLSVAGGLGQITDVVFAAFARLAKRPLILHHHSYAYLNEKRFLSNVLLRISGPDARHIVLCPAMIDELTKYGVAKDRVRVLSNIFAIGQIQDSAHPAKVEVKTLGFLSNISEAKGIFRFLETVARVNTHTRISAVVAGPFEDSRVERQVRQILATMPEVEYVGAVSGVRKGKFFADVDVLLFPTTYVNEAEPLTIHEAMANGVPVIAAARGCISSLIPSGAGKVVTIADSFVEEAANLVLCWLESPTSYRAASASARQTFEARKRLSSNVVDIVCGV